MSSSTQTAAQHTRSIYRQILRELPSTRSPAGNSSTPSPLRISIRKHISSELGASKQSLARRQEAEQFVQYLQAQRIYGSLLERYNPGMGMNEEERVRLSARRVGMEMPVEWYGTGKKS